MFNVGDRVQIVSTKTGTVIQDPTKSMFSILVDFEGEIARLPADGTLLGMKSIRLVKIENIAEPETYEHP